MRHLVKAELNIEELVKKIDEKKLIEAAQKEYEAGAEYFSENCYDDNDMIDWDYCQPKMDVIELYEESEKYADDFSDSYVYEYICEATGIDDFTDEQLGQIMKHFGNDTIKEYVFEHGYTDKAGKYFSVYYISKAEFH